MAIHELRAERATKYDAFKVLADKGKTFDKAIDQPVYDSLKGEIKELDLQIARAVEAQDLASKSAEPVVGQEERPRVAATAKFDPWTNEDAAKAKGLVTNKGLIFGG